MSDLIEQINKRMTLNLLIQGSSTHAFLTSHYLVADELKAIHPSLLQLYDKFSLAAMMTSWIGMNALIHGKPKKFWGAITKPEHPFSKHPLLVQHGPALADGARRHTEARARQKGVRLVPVLFSIQVIRTYNSILGHEAAHISILETLAKKATQIIWGINPERLDGRIVGQKDVPFGNPRKPTTEVARGLRNSVAGFGGVLRSPDGLRPTARAVAWPLLSHELVKAVVELICMHGLNTLDRETYLKVVEVADQIEFEPWMIQAGSELWRRFLAVHPVDANLAHTIMQLARMDPPQLESLMCVILERPDHARKRLERL